MLVYSDGFAHRFKLTCDSQKALDAIRGHGLGIKADDEIE